MKTHTPSRAPYVRRITAFITLHWSSVARGDSTMSSTATAFIVGVVLGKCGLEEGMRHLDAIDATVRLQDSKTVWQVVSTYLQIHHLYDCSAPPRRPTVATPEKRARLIAAGWRAVHEPPDAEVERWYAPGHHRGTFGGYADSLNTAWRKLLDQVGA